MKSFTDGFINHADKLQAYRDNVCEQFGHKRAVGIALLIELHSDFSDCFLHQDGRSFKPEVGKLLLFDDMVTLIKTHQESIDFVIFGSYEPLKDNVVEAAIIRLALLKESLRRNKLPVFRYLGEDRERPIYEATQIKPSATVVGDQIDFELERESRGCLKSSI